MLVSELTNLANYTYFSRYLYKLIKKQGVNKSNTT